MKNETTKNQTGKITETENQQAAILDFQKSFEQRKEYFKEKERKVQILDSLEKNIDTLNSVQHDNSQREECSNFFNENNAPQCFVLEQQNEYNRTETLFKVTNPALISEILHLLTSKMRKKAEELKADILA